MIYDLIRPLLFALDAEASHRAAVGALAAGIYLPAPACDPKLKRTVMGIAFPNPVGLAAGFDKHAEAPDAMLALGFGFVELGTVTPRPQFGNPKPRLFRLADDRALINRLGFNSEGLAAVARRLEQRRARPGIIGVNIGRNRETGDEIEDYVKGVAAFAPLADYLAVNISSPNTPGLRELQRKSAVARLMERLVVARAQAVPRHPPPLLLKIAPDLTPSERADLAAAALTSGVDGLIVANTTVSRRATLRSPQAHEPGGLSGEPLFAASTALIADMARLTQGKIPIVGVGGVASGADAYAKIRAGASLVQLYTALIYRGPGLVAKIKRELAELLRRDGFATIGEAVGSAPARKTERLP